jgi:hypothetical protein
VSVLALARAAGVPRARLRAFVRGEGTVTLRTAAKQCDYLGLELRQAV